MSNENAAPQGEITAEQVETILKRDPEVHQACLALDKALQDYNQTQSYILAESQKGIQVPNLEKRTHAVQTNLAIALDNLAAAGEACDDNQVKQIAIGVQQQGVMYFQSILVSIHYSRMQMKHGDKSYQRLLHEAYALFERAQKTQSKVTRLS